MYQVQITTNHIGYSKIGSITFVKKEKIKDSIFIEQQKKYHEIVTNLNNNTMSESTEKMVSIS